MQGLEDLDFFLLPFRVEYNSEYPVYNHIRDSTELAKKLILTKFIDWEYEDEYRVHKINYGKHKFKKSSLKEVLLGVNCNPDNAQRMSQLLADNGYKATLTKLKKDEKKFAIQIE